MLYEYKWLMLIDFRSVSWGSGQSRKMNFTALSDFADSESEYCLCKCEIP